MKALLKLVLIFLLMSFNPVNGLQTPVNATGKGKIDNEKKLLVYTYEIKDMIAKPVWRLTKKAFDEASKMKADIIIIHLNTYGGTLDAADSIRTKILNSSIPVFVFIDNNAASAGALISIACDSIYMRPGGSIGAATVVNQQGEPMPDKYQSFMRSMMRSTAETKGRDPKIAEAMVDPTVYVENISDSNKVLTFTATEAIKHGYCEAKANNIKDVLKKCNIENYELKKQQLTGMDKFINFLISPVISSILIMMIIGGIYFELQSPGIGFALAIAIIGALLYFAPLYVEGLAENWEILLFIGGLVLIGVELFVIPGFGVAGIAGIILVMGGLVLSMVDNIGFDFSYVNGDAIVQSFFIVIISFFLALILSFYVSRKLFTTSKFKHLALQDIQQKEDGYTSADNTYKVMIGQQGITHTMLRPSGKVEIEDEIYDATAISGYIDKGKKIEVIKYETAQLFVRKV